MLFAAVLFVMRFRCLFSGTSGVNCVRPRDMGVVSRFLVMSSFVVLRSFTMMASGMGMMFLCLLVVFGCLLRHVASSVPLWEFYDDSCFISFW